VNEISILSSRKRVLFLFSRLGGHPAAQAGSQVHAQTKTLSLFGIKKLHQTVCFFIVAETHPATGHGTCDFFLLMPNFL
jgi:hypothetical protein